MELTLHFDGSCYPNPGGLAKYGYTLSGRAFGTCGNGLVGENEFMSNNHAEFYAMSEGLEHILWVLEFGAISALDLIKVKGDSEVALRLMTGAYRANRQKLYYPQYVRAKMAQERLSERGVRCDFMWIPREQNQEADDLSKLPINNASAELLDEAEATLADLLADVKNS